MACCTVSIVQVLIVSFAPILDGSDRKSLSFIAVGIIISGSSTINATLERIKGRVSPQLEKHRIASHRTALAHPHLSTQSMDFFATLFSVASNVPEAEPAPSTPIDADGGGSGGTGGCVVA